MLATVADTGAVTATASDNVHVVVAVLGIFNVASIATCIAMAIVIVTVIVNGHDAVTVPC